jgi:voltage-gated potassium channel Kch
MIVRSFVPNLVARYGESPARVLATGAVTVLACGLVYNAFDLVEHAESGDSATLFEALYFSGLTFTTLGYGDFNPANELGQVLAVTETSIGVVLLAILVFVFGRRATR